VLEEIQENKNIRIIKFSIQIWAAPKHKLEALVNLLSCRGQGEISIWKNARYQASTTL